MSENGKSMLKLGLFVMAGLFFLIFALYLIGISRNLLGSTIEIGTRFKNANGLKIGNNICFSGIKVGTVKSIKLIKDTTVEVRMLIDDQMTAFIHKNATASVGTEGLMGKKIVNILPGISADLPIQDGDLLPAGKTFSKDEMLLTFANTNANIQDVSYELAILVHRVNTSKALWGVLDEASLPSNIKLTLNNIRQASTDVNRTAKLLDDIVSDVKAGKGTAGVLLADTVFEGHLKEAISKIELIGDKATGLVDEFNSMTRDIHHDIQYGPGTVHALLTDSMTANKLNLTLDNIQRGTKAFDQDMEALKHNFMLRGYFRRLEKKQRDSVK